MESKVLTVDEVAAYMRISRSTVYRMVKQQKLPGFKVGSDWRFSADSIKQWMHEQESR